MMTPGKFKAKSISKLISPVTSSSKAATVHSIFERSCNLLFDKQLIGIVPLEFGNNPNAIVLHNSQSLKPWTGYIEQGMSVQTDISQILIGPGVIIDLSKANIWNPELLLDFTDLKNKLTRLNNLIASIPNPLTFLKTSFDYFNSQNKNDTSPGYITDKITFFVQSLFVKKKEYSPNNLKAAASDLIGLGAGLTPSGDDFLAGLVGTLNCFAKNNHACPLLNQQIIALNKVILSTLETSKTTLISEALLKSAINGFFSQKTGDFLSVLFENNFHSKKSLDQRFEDVLSIGHSSGADLLSGIYIAIVRIQNQTSKL